MASKGKEIEVVNRKEELGYSKLCTEREVTMSIMGMLSDRSITYTLIGGSAIGTAIEVPNEWIKQRYVSNLIDVEVYALNLSLAGRALEESGWIMDRTEDMFSIRISDGSETRTIPTIEKEVIYHKQQGLSTYYVAVTGLPTTLHKLNRKGEVVSVGLSDITTYSETVSYKLIRGNRNDVDDIAYIGASNYLSEFIDTDEGARIISRHMENHGSTLIRRNISKVSEALDRAMAVLPDQKEKISSNREFINSIEAHLRK